MQDQVRIGGQLGFFTNSDAAKLGKFEGLSAAQRSRGGRAGGGSPKPQPGLLGEFKSTSNRLSQ